MKNKIEPRGEFIGEFLASEQPESVPLMGTWLLQGTLVMLFSGTGIGKTFLGLELAHALATGRKFLRWSPEKPVKVCYFDGELGKSTLYKRIWQIEGQNPIVSVPPMQMRVVSVEHYDGLMPNLSNIGDQKIYTTEADGCEVLIIDNLLSCSMPENKWDDDLKQWYRIQRWARSLVLTGKTIVFVHHSGKSGDSQLGTSLRENAMDTIIQLKRPLLEEYRNRLCFEWHFTKARHFFGDAAQSLFVDFDSAPTDGCWWKWKMLRDFHVEAIEALHYKGLSKREIVEHLQVPVSFVTSVLEMKTWKYGEQRTRSSEDLF